MGSGPARGRHRGMAAVSRADSTHMGCSGFTSDKHTTPASTQAVASNRGSTEFCHLWGRSGVMVWV